MVELTSAPGVSEPIQGSDVLPVKRQGSAGPKQLTMDQVVRYVGQSLLTAPGQGGGASSGGGTGSGTEVTPGTPVATLPTATRYRVRTLEAGAGGGVGWGNIDFTGENFEIIATDGVASASSELAGNPADEAFDGNLGFTDEGWRYDPAEESAIGSWIEFQFDVAQKIGRIGLTTIGGASGFQEAPSMFIVEYHDGTSWKSLGTFRAEWTTASGHYVQKWFTLVAIVNQSTLVSARQWRLLTVEPGSGGGVSWGYIALYDRFDGPHGYAGTPGSSSEEPGFPASAAWDDNRTLNGGWQALIGSEAGSWTKFNFAVATEVASVKVAPIMGAGWAAKTPTEFDLQFFDGTDWVTSESYTHTWADNDGPVSFTVGDAPDGSIPPPAPSADAPATGGPYGRQGSNWVTLVLSALADVDTTGLADGDTLVWDAGTSKFIPGEAGGGGGATECIVIAVTDQASALAAGAGKFTFRMPYAFTLTAVRASVKTASSSGVVTVDINEGGASILSTKLTVDQGEKSSTSAAIPVVISDATLADDAEITIDIDGAGTGAVGLVVSLIGHQ